MKYNVEVSRDANSPNNIVSLRLAGGEPFIRLQVSFDKNTFANAEIEIMSDPALAKQISSKLLDKKEQQPTFKDAQVYKINGMDEVNTVLHILTTQRKDIEPSAMQEFATMLQEGIKSKRGRSLSA